MERKPGEVDHLELERPSPLTDMERVMIQDSWAKVFQNCDDVGVAILIRLFVNFPTSKQFFSHFKHIEDSRELEQSSLLRKHAHKVMGAINTLVENLGNAEKVASVLKLVGKSHALKHNVDPAYFKVSHELHNLVKIKPNFSKLGAFKELCKQILSGVILEVLGEEYPEVVTPDVGIAWTKLLATLCYSIKAVYEEVDWTPPSASTASTG